MNQKPNYEPFESELFELIENSGKNIQVNFITKDENHMRDDERKTSVKREGYLVKLCLYEGDTIEEHISALKNTKDLLSQIDAEIKHECSHPNIFKAMRNKYYFIFK